MAELLSWSAREIRELTGFDQVMVYRFHPDQHGEVVAESRAPGMQPYLGHHFPASDIPLQARQLYLKKLSRVICSTPAGDARLVPLENPLTGEQVDLTLAELRAISANHLQFMQNMGQAATMSFSLIHDGTLIGLVTCAHRTAISIPYALRQGFESLARQIALQWAGMEQVDQLRRRDALRVVRKRLRQQVDTSTSLGAALTSHELTLGHLIPADTAAVHIDGEIFVVGDPIAPARLAQFFATIEAGTETHLASDALSRELPALAETVPAVAGVLVVPFGTAGDYLAWFRRERQYSIQWLGDQSDRPSELSPRNSLATWNETVSGTSLAWEEVDVSEAVELSRDLDTALLRRAHADLIARNHELADAIRARDMLLAMVTHDLRSPLSAIIGYTDLLADETSGLLNAGQQSQLAVITRNSLELLETVNELVEFSELESGAARFSIESVDMAAAVDAAVTTLQPAAQAKGLRLIAVHADGVVRIRTDPRALSRVLNNLASNAIKFTDTGSITLRTSIHDGRGQIEVTDTGLGIAAADQKVIFDAFERGSSGVRGHRGGIGLGLHICAQLTALTSGDIAVRSEIGTGSTFTVSWPLG